MRTKNIKKTVVMSVLTVLFTCAFAWAVISPPLQVALNTSTYTAIQLGSEQACSAFAFWTEDGTSYYLSSQSDGSDAILVPEDTPLSVSLFHGRGEVLFYAKAVSGTPNMAVLVRD